MRLLATCFGILLTLSLIPTCALAEALHAPRRARGLIQVVRPPGCEGPVGNNPALYSEEGRYQAYVCRSLGTTSAGIYNTRRRNSNPVVSLTAGHVELLWLSSKGNKLAVLSDVPLTTDPLVGDWALYVYTRQSQGFVKVLEDDPEGLRDLIGSTDCPGDDLVSLGVPTVEHLDNRGKMLVRLARATAAGECPGGPLYMEVRE